MNNKNKNNSSRTLMTVISIIAFMFITGTILGISRGTYSNSVFDNCLFIGDSRYRLNGVREGLAALGENVSVQAVSGSRSDQWNAIIDSGSGYVHSETVTLPSSASCVSIMLGANCPTQFSETKSVMKKLHNRYPNAKIVFNSVYHLGSNYTYIDKDQANALYDTFNNEMEEFCEANSDWAAYADVTAGLYETINGKQYLRSDYRDDSGIHITGAGVKPFVENVKNEVGRFIGGSPVEYTVTLNPNGKGTWESGGNGVKTVTYTGRKYINDFPKMSVNVDFWSINDPDCSTTTNKIMDYVDYVENGKTLYACASTSDIEDKTDTREDDDSQEIADLDVPYSDEINGDRCYKGKWVRVTTCQDDSFDGARCKLSDGTLVLRKGDGLTATSGCDDLPDAYEDIIDDYRCNNSAGKWVYISSCQSSNLIGAKCKTENGTIVRTNLTDGPGCSSKDGSNQSINNIDNGDEISDNPFTGTREFIIWMIIGIMALFISGYYFRRNKLLNINNVTNS